MNLTVACVLKSGGQYDAEWVAILRAAVARHMSWQHRFVCLTDMDVSGTDAEAVPLEENWPGWWSKIELFRPDLFDGPMLYLDLDSVIVGDLSGLPVNAGFCAMQEPSRVGGICSTAMAWRGDFSAIYRQFWSDPETYMWLHDHDRADRRIGDQAFIYATLRDKGHRPSVWKGRKVCSFKHHCKAVLPPGAAVVAFHGKPKPPEALDVAWVRDNWRV